MTYADELKAFRDWFANFDADLWDRQIEADSKRGALDSLANRALADSPSWSLDHFVIHHAAGDFWKCYRSLPAHVQEVADCAFSLLNADPKHPSLHFVQYPKSEAQR